MNTLEVLQPILYTVITTVVSVVAMYVSKFLITKRKQINTQVENDKLNTYLDMALSAVNDAVLTISQTYVDSLKKSGKFDIEAQNLAKNKAIDTATALMTEDVRKAIDKMYGDFNLWLDTAIESSVKENK